MATNTTDVIEQIQQLGGSIEGSSKELKTRLSNIIEDNPITFDVIYKMNVTELRQALKKRNANIHCDEKVALSEKEDLQLQLFQCLLQRRGEHIETNKNDTDNIVEYDEKKQYIKPKQTVKSKRKGKKINSVTMHMYIVSEMQLIKPFKFTIAASVNSKVNLKIGKLNTPKNLQSVIKQLTEVKQMKQIQIIQSKIFDTIYLNEIRHILQQKFSVSNISLAVQNIQIKTKKTQDNLMIKNGSATLIADGSYIGDLIICLPIRTFDGGQLIIDPNASNSIISFAKWMNNSYDKNNKEFSSLYWAAIRKNYKYKLKNVSKGYQLIVQYGMYSVMDIETNKKVISNIQEERVKELIGDYTLME